MILADTSVWIEHLRVGSDLLAQRLERREILMHPFVLCELMLGSLRDRKRTLCDLRALPDAPVATRDEVAAMIEAAPIHGRGIGYVDAALLASVRLYGAARLWTKDRRLAAMATELAI
jgi:predicted nucleic acid-binding protein